MKNEKLLKEGSILRLLACMSLPVILVMLVNVIYNMADVFFLGKAGDAVQVAAVSLAAPLFSAFSALNTLLGFGACTAASMALGRGESRKVSQYASFCLGAALILGTAILAAVQLCDGPLLALLGATGALAPYTAEYLRIFSLGAPFMIAAGALGNVLRADGEAKGAVIAAMLGTLVNIVLDPLMISALHMGVAGAAWATVIGNLIGFIATLVAAKRKDMRVSLRAFTLRREISLRVLSLGLPMAAGTLLMSFSGAFANRLFVGYGSEAVAAQSVAGKAGMLVAMLVMGICMGVQPAVSFAYGQKDKQRLRRIVRGVTAAAVLVAAALSLLFICIRRQFVGAFLDDLAVVALGERMVVACLATAAVGGVYQMCQVYLQGTGKVSFATFTALLQKGIVYIPVLYLTNALAGLSGLIWSGAVTDLIATLAGVILCVRRSRELDLGEIVSASLLPEKTGTAPAFPYEKRSEPILCRLCSRLLMIGQ